MKSADPAFVSDRSAPRSGPPAKPAHRIALLFDANKVYDREIIEGIGSYLDSTRTDWNFLLEEDFRVRPGGLVEWGADGIIADFDDLDVCEALARVRVPVVGVGSSCADPSAYPAGVPYVATDNDKLVELAHDHLIEAGLPRLALCSLPEADDKCWVRERERAFARRAPDAPVYRGRRAGGADWQAAIDGLADWVRSLDKPVGIVAVTDARGRQLMQVCMLAGIAVPGEVAIVGIDNDPLANSRVRFGLSSVRQGTQQMGRTAAGLLHRMLGGARFGDLKVVVPPPSLDARASSQHIGAFSANVMKARYYIRRYACTGIKNEQLAAHVGVCRSTLEHAFRTEVGTTLHRELLAHRILAAQHLLRDSTHSTAEIAGRCGFTSLQYMHVVFKRELATTPAAYRREAASCALQSHTAAAAERPVPRTAVIQPRGANDCTPS